MCQDCEYPGQLARDEPDDYGPVTGPDPWDYRPTLRARLAATPEPRIDWAKLTPATRNHWCAITVAILAAVAHHQRPCLPARHPKVTWINAITSCPTESTARCFVTADEAFAAMVSERPYNNTMLSVRWCEDDHQSAETNGGDPS